MTERTMSDDWHERVDEALANAHRKGRGTPDDDERARRSAQIDRRYDKMRRKKRRHFYYWLCLGVRQESQFWIDDHNRRVDAGRKAAAAPPADRRGLDYLDVVILESIE